MGEKSPVYAAVEKVMGLFDLKGVKIFLYEKGFETLWGFLEPDGNELPQTMVVVWDGTPSGNTDPVNVSKYLTPLDWAVGFSLSINEGKLPDSRIIVLDTESEQMDGLEGWRRNVELMPWVRMCRAGDERDFICTLFDPNFKSMKEADKPDMDFIKNLWAARLTRPSDPGDHHALANLVGPLLLMDEDNADLHVKTLQNLMRAIELLPKPSEDQNGTMLLGSKNPWIDWTLNEWKNRIDTLLGDDGNSLNLILVDDMHLSGWGKMLCKAVGAEFKKGKDPNEIGRTQDNKVVIRAFSSADWILKKLKEVKGDRRFNFSLCGDKDKNDEYEILFLDLRLFAGRDIKEEAIFFEKLLRFAGKFKEDSNKNLPWSGFIAKDVGDVKEVEGWITLAKNTKDPSGEREKDAYIIALTLLPRILALTDMSFPIVLFSSTGRRDIAEKLKSYGNIITVFEKPRFTVDVPEDIAGLTMRKFQDAMEKAFQILHGRQICKKVIELKNRTSSSPLVPVGVEVPAFNHIEIYLDEVGLVTDQVFSVGGLVMTYPDYKMVEKLNSDLKNENINWCTFKENNGYLSKVPDKGKGNINWEYAEIATKLFTTCKTNNIFIGAVCVTDEKGRERNISERHFPLKDVQGDTRYINLLKIVLELVLFELLSSWNKEENEFTVSIFPATRTPNLHLPKNDILDKNETPTDYYGFNESKHTSGKYYTISHNSIASLVADVLNSRSDLKDSIAVHHARGVTLFYGWFKEEKAGREKAVVQHYYAEHALKKKNIYVEQYKVGFNTKSDADMHVLLRAQREMFDDNLPLAIKLASSCSDANEKMHGHIMKKIVSALDKIDGVTFLNICRTGEEENVDFRDTAYVRTKEVSRLPQGEKRRQQAGKSPKTGITIKYVDGKVPRCRGREETITIEKVIQKERGILLQCRGENGKVVIVSPNQTNKIGADAYKIKLGDKISALVKFEPDCRMYYGRNISLINAENSDKT